MCNLAFIAPFSLLLAILVDQMLNGLARYFVEWVQRCNVVLFGCMTRVSLARRWLFGGLACVEYGHLLLAMVSLPNLHLSHPHSGSFPPAMSYVAAQIKRN